VIFNVNGEKVHKSDIIKKTLNPKWSNEKFTVNIVSDLYFFYFFLKKTDVNNQGGFFFF
jgi:Ca2+-dependent lipid-binding protein